MTIDEMKQFVQRQAEIAAQSGCSSDGCSDFALDRLYDAMQQPVPDEERRYAAEYAAELEVEEDDSWH